MADQNKITSWLIQHRAELNPNFTEFNWPSRYFEGLYDFEATITIDCTTFFGRGIDKIKTVALEKASAEAIERFICNKFDISTIGVAISGEISSRDHARNEVYERYYFNEHIAEGRYFKKVNIGTLKTNELAQLVARFKSQNSDVAIDFFNMAPIYPPLGTICRISFAPNLCTLGLSFHIDANKSFDHAFQEAIANYAYIKDSDNKIDKAKIKSEKLWQCDPDFINSIQHLFDDVLQNQKPIQAPFLDGEHLDISKIAELKDCPIHPIRFIARKEDK